MRYPKLFIGFVLAATLLMGGIIHAIHYVPPAKYGQEFTLHFSIYDSNSPWQYYETAPAADDVYIRKDGGAAARATNAVTDLDHTMSLVLTATEMTAAVVTVDVNDESSPALYGSDTWVIYTYGNASAAHAFDLDDADPSVDVAKINGVATSSVTTVNANLGTTAAVAFTGALVDVHLKGADDNVIVDPNAADVWAYATRTLSALDEDATTIDLDGSAVGSVTGAVGSVTGAVGSVTGNVGGTINGLTAVALADFFDTDSTTNYAAAAAGSVVKEIADNAGGSSLDVGDIADEVVAHMDANSTDLDTIIAGSTFDPNTTPVQVSSTAIAAIAAAVPSSAFDPNTTPVQVSSTGVAAVADGVWDEALGGHAGAGSAGAALSAAGAAGDPWLTDLPGAYAAGTAGYRIGTYLDASIGDVNATVDVNAIAEAVRIEMDANSVDLNAVLADTNELQTDWHNGGRLDLLLDAIKAMTDLMAVVTTTVATATDANEFTITAGQDVNDAYTMHAIMVQDATDSHAEVRWIEEYVTSRSVLLDEPLSFTPEAGDKVWVLGPVYGGLLSEMLSSLNISKVPVYFFDATTDGASEGAGGVTHYQSDGTDP